MFFLRVVLKGTHIGGKNEINNQRDLIHVATDQLWGRCGGRPSSSGRSDRSYLTFQGLTGARSAPTAPVLLAFRCPGCFFASLPPGEGLRGAQEERERAGDGSVFNPQQDGVEPLPEYDPAEAFIQPPRAEPLVLPDDQAVLRYHPRTFFACPRRRRPASLRSAVASADTLRSPPAARLVFGSGIRPYGQATCLNRTGVVIR